MCVERICDGVLADVEKLLHLEDLQKAGGIDIRCYDFITTTFNAHLTSMPTFIEATAVVMELLR
jgi:hypothetical protein